MTVTYTVGDTREVIKGIADGSVDLIASSPPFLALRSYLPTGHESKGDEIGSETNPAAFVDTLLGLTAEWGRVLAPHGSIAIELGDTYSGSGGAGGDYNEGGLRDGQQRFKQSGWADAPRPIYDTGHTYRKTDDDPELPRAQRGGGAGWPRAKSLALIPQLYAVALAYGINPLTGAPSPAGRWLVRNVIVWHRPNPAVGALGDKVRPSTSYIVVATRSAKRWFDLTAVRTAHTEPGAQRQLGGRKSPNGGDWTRDESSGQNPAGAPPLDCWFDEWDGSHDTWTLTTQPSSLAHYAMWPAKLAERLILMMCPREVCRVCGEPRRRVERYVNPDGAVLRGSLIRGRNFANARPIHAERVATIDQLGWTDCGCAKPPCDWHQKDLTCSDCGDNYRPGLVLDPFAGSGTTLAVADLHGRDAIGIDFDARNKAIYPARYDEVKRALYGTPAPMPGQGDLFAEEVPA